MSDHIEHQCGYCGSFLHHDSKCPDKPVAPDPKPSEERSGTPQVDAEWKRLKDAEKPFPVSGAFAADVWADVAIKMRNFARSLESQLAEAHNQVKELRFYKEHRLPADWTKDSSLETWFPYTAQELEKLKLEREGEEELRAQIATLQAHLASAHRELGEVRAERDEARKRQPINTSLRLFDLVRYMRADLLKTKLITEEEYGWLCGGSPMANSPKGGSPSRERLEEYDEMRAERDSVKQAFIEINDASSSVIDDKSLEIGAGKTFSAEVIYALIKSRDHFRTITQRLAEAMGTLARDFGPEWLQDDAPGNTAVRESLAAYAALTGGKGAE